MLPPLLSGTSGIGAPMPVGCSSVMAGAWSCTICATALMAAGASTESAHAHTRNAVPETASVSQSAHCCGPSLSATGVLVRSNARSEEHTSELQSRGHLVCRLLLEKKNKP